MADLVITSNIRIVDLDKLKLSKLITVAPTNRPEFNGMITAATEASITITGKTVDGAAAKATFTAEQLFANDYDTFLIADRLSPGTTISQSESSNDLTTFKDIFNEIATAPGQFAKFTLDGVTHTNAVVTKITQTVLTLTTAKGAVNITVPQAKSTSFGIAFADDLGEGSGTYWTFYN